MNIKTIISILIGAILIIFAFTQIAGAQVFGGNYFRRSGTALITVPSSLTIGSDSNRVAGVYTTILDATNLTISGTSASDLDMGGYDITNAGTVTADNFVATSTTLASSIAYRLGVGGVTPVQPLHVYTSGLDASIFRLEGDLGTGGTKYADMYVNQYGVMKINGTAGSLSMDMDIKITGSNAVTLGNNDYYLRATANSGDLKLYVGDSDGAGTDWTALNIIYQTSNLLLAPITGNVGIGTSSPTTLLDIFSTATTTIKIDSNSVTQGGCLKMKDIDGVGYSYGTSLAGVITWSTVSCE